MKDSRLKSEDRTSLGEPAGNQSIFLLHEERNNIIIVMIKNNIMTDLLND